MSDALTRGAQAARRRTFAIISHPDAGKTTLTERLLLAGGAIHLAGQVRARGESRRTRSDWMRIERERGISVSASVMTFERDGIVFNLLDTPGHEDFSEDTYRTLTAADSAIMVLDAAKGVEPRTLKLVEVCRLRDIPIITFINKMDREARDSFELLDDIGDKLQLDASPFYWPVGSGQRFRGAIDLSTEELLVYKRAEADAPVADAERVSLSSNSIANYLERDELDAAREESQTAKAICPAFIEKSFREGHMTPVFWGSALRHFGIKQLLDGIATLSPPPHEQAAENKTGHFEIQPADPEVTGFVFKIQANMDPQHRDRVAFVRLSSGKFTRGMRLKTASGKAMNVHNPLMFFAQDREIADEAFPGDVIGVPNHGVLRVGDSLSESGNVRFRGIPNFAPEILRRARLGDPLKAKHLRRALESLSEEGVTQLFRPFIGADLIVGAVGALQFEVLEERVKDEYGIAVAFEPAPYSAARWISSDDPAALQGFVDKNQSLLAFDIDESPVFLAKNNWELGYVQEKNPNIKFSASRERDLT
ncbi:MAG: peptide chain release factor 3 [Caulobacterales bacterium]